MENPLKPNLTFSEYMELRKEKSDLTFQMGIGAMKKKDIERLVYLTKVLLPYDDVIDDIEEY
jgi:hypothetical protein